MQVERTTPADLGTHKDHANVIAVGFYCLLYTVPHSCGWKIVHVLRPWECEAVKWIMRNGQYPG